MRAQKYSFSGSVALAMVLLCVGMVAHAADLTLQDIPQCPAELVVRQNVETSLTGWKAFNTHRTHPFLTVSFFDGPPEEKALLMPDSEKRAEKRGKVKTGVWELSVVTNKWVSCEYAGTSATVVMRLPDATTRCEVEYDTDFTQPVARHWACFSAPGAK